MISADRFIVRSHEHEAWLAARRRGVTATEVSLAATPSGFREALDMRLNPVPIEENDYMTFGKESEAEIMRHAHEVLGILPSDWLIAGENRTHLATPDGLSLDHHAIAECKTTGKDWAERPDGYVTIPIKYRRQIQWQLHVTGADECWLLWNLRVPDNNGWFYLGWMEPKAQIVLPDPQMIAELVEASERLMNFEMESV